MNETTRLMGFGHRVYKNYDPRAKILRKSAHDVLARLGVQSELLEIAMELEELALKDDYFVSRKLYPNVDFYSGVILQGHRHPGEHVHRDVRPRSATGLDRPVARDARRQAAHRAAASDLHRRQRAPLRPPRRPLARGVVALARHRAETGATHVNQSLWLDGEWVSTLPQMAPGCYTTGRYSAGRLRHGDALAGRLVRDAHALGLGSVDGEACLEAMRRVGEKVFGTGGGIVRIDAARDESGRVRLLGRGRSLGPEELRWAAVTHHEIHPNRKPRDRREAHPRSGSGARASYAGRVGADEALVAGPDSTWIEGGRTNLFVRSEDGRFVTPPVSSGAVRGVAREILLERDPLCEEGEVSDHLLRSAREVVACNAVCGAIAVVRIDGQPVGAVRSVRARNASPHSSTPPVEGVRAGARGRRPRLRTDPHASAAGRPVLG